MNEVQAFIQNFAGNHESAKDINDFMSNKFELLTNNVNFCNPKHLIARMGAQAYQDDRC